MSHLHGQPHRSSGLSTAQSASNKATPLGGGTKMPKVAQASAIHGQAHRSAQKKG